MADPAVTDTSSTTTTEAPWHGGDTEIIGYLQNRGLHDKPVNEVALAAIKAHREAERHLGVPANELQRWPKDAADEAGWKSLYARMGVPETPDAYTFDGLKFSDGSEVDAAFTDFLRAEAAKWHLPKEAAAGMAQAFVRFADQQVASDNTEQEAALVTEREALAKSWGPNAEGNKFIATQAAKAFGITEEEVNALEKTVGYARTMEFLRQVGSRIGEDKFITNTGNNGSGAIRTYEQALDEKASLMGDQAFVKRFLGGDVAAVKQMHALDVLITAGSAQR